MNKTKTIYLAFLATLSVACTSDGSPEASPSAEAPDAIVLTASMGQGGATRGGQAIQATAFDEGELISVEVTPTGGTMQSSVYRAGAATEGNGFKNPLTVYSRAITWPANNGTVGIRAYYPSTVGSTTVGSSTESCTVQADQSQDDDYKLSDLMYAEAVNGQAKVSSVPLTFHHALSKIVVNLVAGNAGVGASDLAACEVAVKACRTTAITNGVATSVTNAVSADDYGWIPIGTGAALAAVIVPQTIAGTTASPVPFLRVNWNSKKLYLRLSASKTFEASKQYTYNLKVSGSGLTVESSTVTGWTAQSPSYVSTVLQSEKKKIIHQNN